MVVDIVYYCILGLAIIMSLIIAFIVVGLVLGILLPVGRKSTSGGGCCDKSVASHFLMTSVALTFVFYWLYMLMVVSIIRPPML